MKIKIIKPTVVNGEHVEVGEELEVKKSVANLLINSNKAISLEETEISLSLEISPAQLESVKKELEAEFEKVLAEYKERITSLKAEAIETEKELNEQDDLIEKLNEKIKAREAEYKALYEDIGSMTFKDLKEKYKIS